MWRDFKQKGTHTQSHTGLDTKFNWRKQLSTRLSVSFQHFQSLISLFSAVEENAEKTQFDVQPLLP